MNDDIPHLESPKLSKKKKGGGFQSMNLKPFVFRAIRAKGFNLPTPIQRKVIPLALEGRDIVACSRTGSGKTAAFLLPLINRLEKHSTIIGTRALVLSPTRELALQTSSMYRQFSKFTDLVSSVVVGGHSLEGQFESLASNPDVIFATPGRLAQLLTETNLTFKKLEFLVFDEADFLFEMGFADHINTILEKVSPNRQTLLFSATIPQQLSEFSRGKLKDYVFCKLDSEYTLAEEIRLNFLICRSQEKIPTLLYLLHQIIGPDQTTIVFVSTKYHVELLTLVLQEFSIKNVGIHGKMDQLSRKENLSQLRSQRVKILIVTDLAARGIDIPFVNNVIHFDFPAKPKIFIHRSGRTARAGRSGCVYSLIRTEEMMFISEMAIYIGRKLTINAKELKNPAFAVYGRVPMEAVAEYMEGVEKLRFDANYFKEFDVSEKAFKQFLKTRKKVSKASLDSSKTLDSEAINPLFANPGEQSQTSLKEKEKMIMEIKHYKPKAAVLELSKIRENTANDDWLKILERMKKIEEKAHLPNKQDEIQEEAQNMKEGNEEKSIEKISKKTKPEIRLSKKRQRSLQITENPKKKGKIEDFKHPTQYIAGEPPAFKEKIKGSIENSQKISSEDVNPFLLAESFDEMAKARKQFVWDINKKKFVKGGELTETGKLKRDKEDQGMKENRGKKTFKSWSKRSMLSFQNEGEVEDSRISQRARDLFKNRRMGKFFPGNASSQKEDAPKAKANNRKFRGKKELKTPKQMLKARIRKNKAGLKNMEKGKRREILNRNRKRH